MKTVHLLQNGGEQNGAEYKQKTPMSQVPSLDHDGQWLTQSMAICEYLEDAFPENALLPKNPLEKAKVREFCEVINSGIQPLQNLSLLQKLEKDYGADKDQKKEWIKHWVSKGFDALDHLVSQDGRYCFKDKVSLADAFLVPQLFSGARFGVPVEDWPRLQKIAENCQQLEAFKKAHPSQQPDFEG